MNPFLIQEPHIVVKKKKVALMFKIKDKREPPVIHQLMVDGTRVKQDEIKDKIKYEYSKNTFKLNLAESEFEEKIECTVSNCRNSFCVNKN